MRSHSLIWGHSIARLLRRIITMPNAKNSLKDPVNGKRQQTLIFQLTIIIRMTSTLTLGFDVYGTLVDTHGVVEELTRHVGDLAPVFSQMWREKQLEYTFRRGLMDAYAPFGICTRDALAYTNAQLKAGLNEAQCETLIRCYDTLPAFADALDGLEQAKSAGFSLFAFSNGQAVAVESVLKNAGIDHYFNGVVSVDEVQTFKPNPMVYSHFIERTGASPDAAWLVSSNGFDAIGAVNAGMRAAWIRRTESVILDPWGVEPTVTLPSLSQLIHHLG